MSSIAEIKMLLTVSNAMGLHARPAAQLAHVAGKYPAAQITLAKSDGSGEADCRSVLALLMLAATQGATLQLCVSGENAEQIAAEMQALFNNKFGE